MAESNLPISMNSTAEEIISYVWGNIAGNPNISVFGSSLLNYKVTKNLTSATYILAGVMTIQVIIIILTALKLI